MSEMFSPQKIILDMDGVLADFRMGVLDALGLRLKDLEKGQFEYDFLSHLNKTQFKKFVNEIVVEEDFWANLKEFPHTIELFRFCRNITNKNVAIVTKSWDTPGCLAGKKRWVDEHLRKYFDGVNLIICDSDDINIKSYTATDGALLIDDKEQDSWGCKFKFKFLWPAEYNDKAERVGHEMQDLRQWLQKLSEMGVSS